VTPAADPKTDLNARLYLALTDLETAEARLAQAHADKAWPSVRRHEGEVGALRNRIADLRAQGAAVRE
jgi:hypothetical protein